jgi:hypothetical protein
MKEVFCDSCNQPMKRVKVMKTKKAYKARRYWCKLCNIGKTIFGGKWMDETVIPNLSLEAVKETFKQENEARN